MERHSLVISSIDPAVRQLDVRIRIVRILGLRHQRRLVQPTDS
jgi:hypothetical protein